MFLTPDTLKMHQVILKSTGFVPDLKTSRQPVEDLLLHSTGNNGELLHILTLTSVTVIKVKGHVVPTSQCSWDNYKVVK